MFYIKDKTIFMKIYEDDSSILLITKKKELLFVNKNKTNFANNYQKVRSRKPFIDNNELDYYINIFKEHKNKLLNEPDKLVSETERQERELYFENLSEEEYKKSLMELRDE